MKTSFDIPNTTYYGTSCTKAINNVAKPSSFSYYQQRRKDVIQRLVAEYDYTKANAGEVYFYTLTYSEARIPKFHGINVHDYRHLRWLLVESGFSISLKRHFNTQVKYCITSEFGEGRGRRGYHNNPHFHALFFLTPVDASKPIINCVDFRNFIQSYWQGTSIPSPTFKERLVESIIYTKYEKEKLTFGTCVPGNNCGIVTDVRAIMYVAKYVTKDSSIVFAERAICNTIDSYSNFELDFDGSLWQYALDSFHSICTEYGVSDENFMLFGDTTYLHFPKAFSSFLFDFKSFIRTQESETYRKFHKVRFRASQGLGDSVFTSDKFDKYEATIERKTITKGEFDIIKEKITGQLYRKWFYKVDRQRVYSKSQGKFIINSFYRPNGNLLKYRETHFDKALDSHIQLVSNKLNELLDKKLFIKFVTAHCKDLLRIDKDENIDINLLANEYYERFANSISRCSDRCGSIQLTTRIALYDFVYRGRSYDTSFECDICPKMDYIRFQRSSFYATYKVVPLYDYLQACTDVFKLQNYENHPYFKDCIPYYNLYRRYCDECSFEQATKWFAEEDHKRRCRQLVQGLSRQY